MKGPPTEADLLQLGKAQSLDKIISLDLSRRGLTEVDVKLFNQLTSIESLDISQNKLTLFPSDLHLPKLRVLDLSDNLLQDVKFVKSFKKLLELYVEDNKGIQMGDHYIAKVLCPSLRSIDGGEDIDHIEKGIQLYINQLQPPIEAVWEARYAEVYREGIPASEIPQRTQELFRTATNSNIVGANLTVVKFKQFMIEHLCEKLITNISLGRHGKGRKHGNHSNTSTPIRYGTRVSLGTTSAKDYSKGTPLSKEGMQSSRKRKREESPSCSPRKSPAAKRQKEKHETAAVTLVKVLEDLTVESLPDVDDYEPTTFVRCHAKGNNPSDDTTKVWRCAFEPQVKDVNARGDVVATCGGKIVCLIDCHTGKLLKRYKDSSKSESFYCLAWTTLQADGVAFKDCNILAVAGEDQCVKLIHPKQLVMYGQMTGHRSYISTLTFHPKQTNILFSGSRDSQIIMWDIGVPDLNEFSVTWSRLATMSLPQTDAISIVYQPSLDLLIAGCESSCFAWNVDKVRRSKDKQVRPHYEFVHPVEETDEITAVDGLALLPGNFIVTKCVGHSRLYVWNLKEHTAARSSKLQQVSVRLSVQLKYRPVETDYLYPSSTNGIVCVGDDKGSVFMYDLTSILKQHITGDLLLQPSRILEFPEVHIESEFEDKMKDITETKDDVVVNCVDLSSDRKYMVCGTDNNIVCVWKNINQ